MRRDRAPGVPWRERLGHSPSGDITGHYTHIDGEMITEMLASVTTTERSHGESPDRSSTEPRSAVPFPGAWLAGLSMVRLVASFPQPYRVTRQSGLVASSSWIIRSSWETRVFRGPPR
jgi:hypothetical protein